VKSITIRDLRQRWPEVERLLQTEHELLITRDGHPVAKLVRAPADPAPRPRFQPEEHRRWQESLFGANQIYGTSRMRKNRPVWSTSNS
jgi:antitoxin (DNA-binding transcriptional repressor) of toxin-antitoxin stability system